MKFVLCFQHVFFCEFIFSKNNQTFGVAKMSCIREECVLQLLCVTLSRSLLHSLYIYIHSTTLFQYHNYDNVGKYIYSAMDSSGNILKIFEPKLNTSRGSV